MSWIDRRTLPGVLTGLEYARRVHPEATHVVSLYTDAPFLPSDLWPRLQVALTAGADMAQARSGGRRHPVFAAWRFPWPRALRTALVGEGFGKIDDFTARYERGGRFRAGGHDGARPVQQSEHAGRPGGGAATLRDEACRRAIGGISPEKALNQRRDRRRCVPHRQLCRIMAGPE